MTKETYTLIEQSTSPEYSREIQIRHATEAEFTSILEIDPHCRKETISRALDRGECYVALVNDAVCGFAMMHYHFFGQGFVELLIVADKARRRGLGLALLNYLSAVCTAEKLFTSTNGSNGPMRSLLNKAGFIPCGSIDALDEGDPELFFVKRQDS